MATEKEKSKYMGRTQIKILEFLRDQFGVFESADGKMCPALSEHLPGHTPGGISRALLELIKKGYVKREGNVRRIYKLSITSASPIRPKPLTEVYTPEPVPTVDAVPNEAIDAIADLLSAMAERLRGPVIMQAAVDNGKVIALEAQAQARVAERDEAIELQQHQHTQLVAQEETNRVLRGQLRKVEAELETARQRYRRAEVNNTRLIRATEGADDRPKGRAKGGTITVGRSKG